MKKKAFTLIELVVGMTISIILMVSIGVFVSSGMSNISLQKKVLSDNKELSDDILYLQKNILNSKNYISNIGSNTGILLRQNKYYNKGGFSYIGVKEFDKFYCNTGEITKTNHLYISNFIPLNGVSLTAGNFKSDTKNNQIINTSTNKVVVGGEIYGDKFNDGDFGTGILLNSPTGIVEIDGKIVFSDTLNDRILYLSGSKVYSLLDETDGLNEPIGLAYNSGEKALYIANAGKGEILKLSSKKYATNPELRLENVNKSNINKLEIEINTSEVLTNSTNLGDYSFSNINQNNNDKIELNNNIISYYFVGEYGLETSQSDCRFKSNGDIVFDYPNKVIYCTSGNFLTGTGKLANFRKVNFNNTNITIKNIEPNLVENKNYYVNLKLYEDDNLKYFKYFPYFTQGDDYIFTSGDNTLEIIHNGLVYPYKVNNDGTYTDFNPSSFDYSTLTADFILKNPVKKLEKNYSSNLLNLKIDYYKYFNCYNIDDKIERSFLIKKSY